MTLKKSDLDKQLGLKIGLRMRSAGAPGRYGEGTAAAVADDRRAQRKRDAAAGLVPFACKLPAPLLPRLAEAATQHAGGLNGLVAELLAAGLSGTGHSRTVPGTLGADGTVDAGRSKRNKPNDAPAATPDPDAPTP